MYIYKGKEHPYGKEIPLEVRKAVFQECMEIIIKEAEELGYFDEDTNNTYDVYQEAGSYFNGKKTRILRTKKDTLNYLRIKSALAIATSVNDSDKRRLDDINKKRRTLIDKIVKKYNSQATKAAKTAIKEYKMTSGGSLYKDAGATNKKASIKADSKTNKVTEKTAESQTSKPKSGGVQ